MGGLQSALDGLLRRSVEGRPGVPGVAAVVTDRDRTIYAGAAGVRAQGRDAPMTDDTVFAIYSATKPITATAVLQLVEAGRLDLDAPAKHYVPALGNVQVIDGLWNQVDIPYQHSSLNGATARVDGDGRFRAVLSAEDPGFANWLATGGHRFGMLIGRWYRCSSQPTPEVTRMKASEVAGYLGDRSPRVTADERASAMRERLVMSQLRRKW